jgi:hypothetical protein
MSQKAGSNQVNTGDLSLTLSLASTSRQDNQNGLLLFSTNNKPIKNISELENPKTFYPNLWNSNQMKMNQSPPQQHQQQLVIQQIQSSITRLEMGNLFVL